MTVWPNTTDRCFLLKTEIMIHEARTVPNHTKAVGGIKHVMVLILMGCM